MITMYAIRLYDCLIRENGKITEQFFWDAGFYAKRPVPEDNILMFRSPEMAKEYIINRILEQDWKFARVVKLIPHVNYEIDQNVKETDQSIFPG